MGRTTGLLILYSLDREQWRKSRDCKNNSCSTPVIDAHDSSGDAIGVGVICRSFRASFSDGTGTTEQRDAHHFIRRGAAVHLGAASVSRGVCSNHLGDEARIDRVRGRRGAGSFGGISCGISGRSGDHSIALPKHPIGERKYPRFFGREVFIFACINNLSTVEWCFANETRWETEAPKAIQRTWLS